MSLYLACSSGGTTAAARPEGLDSQSPHRGLGKGRAVGYWNGMRESLCRALWMCR